VEVSPLTQLLLSWIKALLLFPEKSKSTPSVAISLLREESVTDAFTEEIVRSFISVKINQIVRKIVAAPAVFATLFAPILWRKNAQNWILLPTFVMVAQVSISALLGNGIICTETRKRITRRH